MKGLRPWLRKLTEKVTLWFSKLKGLKKLQYGWWQFLQKQIEGNGVAAAYSAQKEVIGQQNVEIIKSNSFRITAGKIQIMPWALVGGGLSARQPIQWMIISNNFSKRTE